MRLAGASRAPSAPSSPQRDRAVGTVRPTAVLAPADQKQQQTGAKPGAQRGLTGAIMTALRNWETRQTSVEASRAAAELTEATAERAQQADALEEAGKAAKDQGPLPDIMAYLRPAGIMETRYMRVLSSLSALTYNLEHLTPSGLMRRHRLKLVSTSKVCDLKLREARQSAAEAFGEGDAMAVPPAAVQAAQAEIAEGVRRAAGSPAMLAVSRVEPLASTDQAVAAAASSSNTAAASQVDRVTASLAAAAAAASAAAQGVYSAAAPYTGPFANNITTFTASVTASLPLQSVAQQLQSAAAVGHSSAIATVATVSAALESTWGVRRRGGARAKECQSPAEWFIADDPSSHTRFFVIQGSDNLDHWRVNLTFDPVPWEDAALGIKVHRGVYEAAQVLYDKFLPLVQDHPATSPFAKVAFTGHSLGGSLGTLLMLMYVRRGVLPKSAVSPVYTFGAPAIFCEGTGACACPPPAAAIAAGGGEGSGAGSASGSRGEGKGACGVLQMLGLPEGAVRNVLMHKDIVPRAFACDYTLVADLLKRVADSFREHRCLNSSRTVMFDFIGKMMVLQPPSDASFVAGEGYHPLLPAGPGLYVLREPTAFNTMAVTLRRDAGFVRQAVQQAISNLPSAGSVAMAAASTAVVPAPRKGAKAAAAPSQPVHSAGDAVWELMNCPHPLDTLADPAAYGDNGSISRYHNPDHYSRALGGVLRARGAAWRRLATNAGNVGMRHFAPVLDAAQQRTVLTAAGRPDSPPSSAAAPSPAERRMSPGGKQSLLPRLSPRGGGGSAGHLAA